MVNCVVSNCLIAANSACFGGGGIMQGTFNNCTVSGNTAYNISSDYFGAGANNAVLNHCTIASNFMTDYGGGAAGCTLNFCLLQGNVGRVGSAGVFCTFNNCILTGNSVVSGGPSAADSSTLNNCAVINNSGGGVSASTLNNCTLSSNTVYGADSSTLNNCIVVSNAVNYTSSSTLNFCFTTPLPTNGTNNTTSDPDLIDGYHIYPYSPCRGAGSSGYATGVDIDGEPWGNPPDIGCDEYVPGGVTGALSVAFRAPVTAVPTNYPTSFVPLISGRVNAVLWNFGDGATATNQFLMTHRWSATGAYQLILTAFNDTYTNGVSATNEILVSNLNEIAFCVAVGNTNPIYPYTSWTTAATNIQDAVDAVTLPGSVVLVSNGIYNIGGRGAGFDNALTRLIVSLPLTVKSVNGPLVTTILGAQQIRCAALSGGASLSGFTLTNGTSGFSHGPPGPTQSGGGVYCATTNEIISNCVIVGNIGAYGAGGVYQGTLYGCVITNNQGFTYGGGAWNSVLIDCVLFGNSSVFGGGAYTSMLRNCTVTGNHANTSGGGTSGCTVKNSVVMSNTSPTGANFDISLGDILFSSCTTPIPANGFGNVTNDPLFVNFTGGDFHLQPNSPCINAGNNAYAPVGTDLDGNPRIVGGTVDMGAYEFQSPTSLLSYAWLQQYGFATDGSADFLDPDQDGMNNYQEWRAGTNPTNAASALLLARPAPSGTNLVVTWQSVTNELYYIQRGTNLNAQPAFLPLATNLIGQSGTTSYTDTNAAGPGPFFYRVGVQ
jgi:PKD domain